MRASSSLSNFTNRSDLPMDAKLVVVGGEARVTEVQLQLPVTIGRGRSAGLTLPHPLVSRQHCEIYEEEGKLVVNDMGSLNGTFVGDQRIGEPTFLMPGELLTVGTVTFRAVYELVGDDSQFVEEESTGTDVGPTDRTVQFGEATVSEFADVEDVEEVEEVDFAESDDVEFAPAAVEGAVEDVVEDIEEVEDVEVEDVVPVEDAATLEADEVAEEVPVDAPVVEFDEAGVEDDEELEFEDVALVEDAPPPPKPKAKPASPAQPANAGDTESANHDTKEVEPAEGTVDEAGDEDGGDDDLQAFLKGLG